MLKRREGAVEDLAWKACGEEIKVFVDMKAVYSKNSSITWVSKTGCPGIQQEHKEIWQQHSTWRKNWSGIVSDVCVCFSLTNLLCEEKPKCVPLCFSRDQNSQCTKQLKSCVLNASDKIVMLPWHLNFPVVLVCFCNIPVALLLWSFSIPESLEKAVLPAVDLAKT